jgi:hypothetical protein
MRRLGRRRKVQVLPTVFVVSPRGCGAPQSANFATSCAANGITVQYPKDQA